MAEYDRVVTFDADEGALEAMVREIDSADGPPAGVAARRITVLADRAAGQIVVFRIRFASEEDLRQGAAAFEAMSPPADAGMRRVSVAEYEVVLERDAS